jgi:hypothetical protein
LRRPSSLCDASVIFQLADGLGELPLQTTGEGYVLTTTELFDDAALAALIAATTVLGSDTKAGLFTAPITPSKTLTIADLTEATYPGYVRQLVVMGTPFRDPVNGISSLSGSLAWFETGTPTPVIIYGVFYTHGATPLLLGVEQFQTPIPLNDLLDSFTTVLQFIQSSDNPGFTTIIR